MKHYFLPLSSPGGQALVVFSPVDGLVRGIHAERVHGMRIELTPAGYDNLCITIFHLEPAVSVGQVVSAGQRLGTHASFQTYSDVAVSVSDGEHGGTRLISLFEIMDDRLLADYRARGVEIRDLIITRGERDAMPLGCDAEGNYTNRSNLNDWIDLIPRR